jgi:predicted RNA-binding Zn-ribbon protein involved in translation (DUF1610 family)
MSAIRLSEKWFNRGLWLVAVAFAWFLAGLGDAIIRDLPKVESQQSIQQFVTDKDAHARLKAEASAADERNREAQEALRRAQLAHQSAQSDTRTARSNFDAWLATRSVTERADTNAEVMARRAQLEALSGKEREALGVVQAEQKRALDATQARDRARREVSRLEEQARGAFEEARRSQELRVFLYRLALVLPLLAISAWLFARKRKGRYWPFAWGFILFSAFAFFVELVPYLPSYGGYVRYSVGIILTVIIGRYAIVALQRYLEEQKKAEALPDAHRRKELAYDVALARLAKKICPGCERTVDLANETLDFCPHCGISLFDRCGKCATRKSTFSPYCHACGAPRDRLADPAPSAPG